MGNIFKRNRTAIDSPSPARKQVEAGPRFGVSIPPEMLYGHYGDYEYAPLPRVDRRSALTVPSVKKSRDLIAGSIGQLPIDLISPAKTSTHSALFNQPEAGTPRSVTMTRLVEDLLFDGIAWLRVTHTDYYGRPVQVVRLDPSTVSISPDYRVWYSRTGSGSAEEYLPDDQVIRIDSPNDGILTTGARAITTCLALATATRNAAKGMPPALYFTPSEGADPVDDEGVRELLREWEKARQKSATAYIPAALQLHALGWNPDQLQMDKLHAEANLEIARLTGVEPSDLGVATATNNTYFNAQDRDRVFVRSVLGPYMEAIAGRFSMDDVTPHGYSVKFNTSAFLRADDSTRFDVYAKGKELGIYDAEYIAEKEDLPAPTGTPAIETQEETA